MQQSEGLVGIIRVSGMKTYIINLESHDDFLSTRDKISWSKARRVLLIWPAHERVLERRVDLLLLLRHSQQVGAQLAIVTRQASVRTNARELGISVFKNMVQAQKSTWCVPSEHHLGALAGRPALRNPQELRALRSQFDARPLANIWLRLAVFLVGLLACLALLFFFLPGARIELSPLQQSQQLTLEIRTSSKITAPNLSGTVPAYTLQTVVEDHQEVVSSGRSRTPDKAASGQVMLTNLTDQPVTVPVESVLLTLTDPPLRFLTTQSVEVPAEVNASVNVPVRAAVPGQAGNVSSGQIQAMQGLVGMHVTVENLDDLSGGSDRSSPIPTEQDFLALREQLLAQLRLSALQEMQTRLGADQRLLSQALKVQSILEEERQPPEGQPADRLQLRMRVEFQGWYVKEQDLQSVAQTALNANLGPGFRPVPQSLQISFLEDPIIDSAGSAEWRVSAAREVETTWAEDQAAHIILGRDPGDAVRLLRSNLSLSADPQITLFPSWWGRLPFLPFRIEMVHS